MTQTCSSAYKHTEIVFTFKEVHSFPFLKTQDSLALFDMCLLSVGPEVEKFSLPQKTHTQDGCRWRGGRGIRGAPMGTGQAVEHVCSPQGLRLMLAG